MSQTTTFSTSMPLSPGAVWRGKQTSGRVDYDVEVRICSITEIGDICGTLTIRNLTPSLPKVVTYFDGEIIGEHHSFSTDKWGATTDDDDAHWGRFKRDIYLKGNASISDAASSNNLEDVVFMRLKERCFLNASKEQDLSGASFAGFYYIAVELNPARSDTDTITYVSPKETAPQSKPLQVPHTHLSLAEFGRGRSISPDRSNSYAAVVRGQSPACPIAISGSKADCEGAVTVTVASATSTEASIYSPPIDEFPLPSSPASFSAFPLDREVHRAKAFSGRASHSVKENLQNLASTSSKFYCPETGYIGPWANATLKGFYFASSSDPYQELKLRYVGVGMGAVLEETQEEIRMLDAWGNERSVDAEGTIMREMKRRERYSRPKGSASFTLL